MKYYTLFLLFFSLIIPINSYASWPQNTHTVTINSSVYATNRVGKTVIEAYKYGAGLYLDNGWVVTAAHVVRGADKVEIRLPNGKKFMATRHSEDPTTDIALLRLENIEKKSIISGQLKFKKPVQGERISAFGNPFNEGIHITQGVIAFTGFSEKNNFKNPIVKTDARVKQGFSGGPLINTNNEVVGIITGMTEAFTYAIPAQLVEEIIGKLQHTGHIIRPSLGVDVIETTELNRSLSLGLPVGLQIIAIDRKSPLNKKVKKSKSIKYKGIAIPWEGDIIVAMEQYEVTSLQDARKLMWQFRNKTSLKLGLQRFTGEYYEVEWLHL